MGVVIHKSQFESDGWISINKETPIPKEKVKLSKINFLDWNLETMEWESEGWMHPNGVFSVKAYNTKDKITLKNSKPTHWKKF